MPGKIVSITINQGGTARQSTLTGGTERLVSSTAADYTTTGTAVGSASTTGWTAADFTGTEYTFFAIQRGANAAYISSIVIEYDASSLAVSNINKSKKYLVKNTSVHNELVFATKSDVKVFNANGQVVKSASVNENTSLNVSELPNGMYIVSGTVDGQPVTQKVMKK